MTGAGILLRTFLWRDKWLILWWTIGVTILYWSQAVSIDGLYQTQAEFEKLHKELQPPRDELWRSIPWHVSILEGREAAAKAKKPIFVWVASGEPLGCG